MHPIHPAGQVDPGTSTSLWPVAIGVAGLAALYFYLKPSDDAPVRATAHRPAKSPAAWARGVAYGSKVKIDVSSPKTPDGARLSPTFFVKNGDFWVEEDQRNIRWSQIAAEEIYGDQSYSRLFKIVGVHGTRRAKRSRSARPARLHR